MMSIPGRSQLCITTIGPSKTESLSGYRLGVVVAPEVVIAAVEQTLAATSLRAPAYAQHLLTRWLVDDREFVAERIVELRPLRDATIKKLQAVPELTLTCPMGTAYLFVGFEALPADDMQVSATLQREAGVIVSPGCQFGPSGMRHFRICYARDEAEWSAALDRIVACLSRLARGQ